MPNPQSVWGKGTGQPKTSMKGNSAPRVDGLRLRGRLIRTTSPMVQQAGPLFPSVTTKEPPSPTPSDSAWTVPPPLNRSLTLRPEYCVC